MVPVTNLRPKSVIASPVHGQKFGSGSVSIRGAAWAGESPVARVEVSTDHGKTWKPARLGKEQARYGWRQWDATWTPPGAGFYILMARAHDASGESQPFVQEWNPSGYLWNVVPQVGIETGVANPSTPSRQTMQTPAFPPHVKTACLGCHGQDIVAQSLTRAQWEREVDKMIRWGAPVKPAERGAIIDFLATHFGPKR
jgi:hypothetical protein